MADKNINELVAATAVQSNDLFVLEQNNTAKKLTGEILENWLLDLADGHGGIIGIAKTDENGLVDTYTVTLAEDPYTYTFTVTNGRSIGNVIIYYAVSSSSSTVPSSWFTTRQTMTATNRYLWSYTRFEFNDGTYVESVKTIIGVYGDKGDAGDPGRGIVDIDDGVHTPGDGTLYTLTMSDGTTETFYSYDGDGITDISKTSTDGLVDTYTITYGDSSTTTFTVTNARSISTITKTGANGLVDTYTITFNDGTTSTFDVTNGTSIASISYVRTEGLTKVFRVLQTDGTANFITVDNGKGISSITQTSGNHAAGTSDVYTIRYTTGDTFSFPVYNGTNGTGSVSYVDGIPSVNQNVPLLQTGNGAPTSNTVGLLNQRYLDLNTGTLYICVGIDTSSDPASYSWIGTGVSIDSAFSSVSTNPVQNAVITAKVGTTTLDTTASDLSGAVNELEAGKYTFPAGGIPATDLATAVQTSLGKADTAYQKPSGGIPASDMASGAIPAVTAETPKMDGTASVGTEAKGWATGDHVHPTDTSRVAKAGDTMSGYLKVELGGSSGASGFIAKSSTITDGTRVTGNHWGTSYRFQDSGDKIIGMTHVQFMTDGYQGVTLRSRRFDSSSNYYDAYVSVGKDENYNTIVKVDDASAWRDELELKYEYIKLNPNLLDNAYFYHGRIINNNYSANGTFPINQREIQSNTSAGYCIDRWTRSSGNLQVTIPSVEDGNGNKVITEYLELKNTSSSNINFTQHFVQPYTFWAGKKLTASVLLSDNTLVYGSLTIPYDDSSSGTSYHTFFDKSSTGGFLAGLVVTNANTMYFRFRISPSATVNVVAIKMELGSEQTLAHNEGTNTNPIWVLNDIPDYGEELRKCQRYFVRMKTSATRVRPIAFGVSTNSTTIRLTTALPQPMVKNPTVTASSGLSFRCYHGGSYTDYSPPTFSSSGTAVPFMHGSECSYEIETTGLTASEQYIAAISGNGAYLDFSAEL